MDSDRSLSGGISIPQWMKSRMIDNRLDLDQGAFSPPDIDDSFLYIRYPRKSRDEGRQKLNENLIKPSVPDPSKHLEPCRPFITGTTPATTEKQLKSNGTDDGFKGKAAACGSSIVKVAHQMVAEKRQQEESEKQAIEYPPGFNANIRRGSKSLPASPLTSPSASPKSRRRLLGNNTNTNMNKYFTAAFENGEKTNNGWILSSLLGKRDLSRSFSTVSEEGGSVTDLATIAAHDDDLTTNKTKPVKQVFKAKPSELREMNFWSPTSM